LFLASRTNCSALAYLLKPEHFVRVIQIGERLRDLARTRQIPDAQIAARLGITPRAYRYYLNDERHPSFEALIALSETFNVTVDYILTGRRVREVNGPASIEIDATAYAALPLYDVRFSAGPGAVNDDCAPVRPVALHRDILAQLGVASGECLLVTVDGNSMEPLFCHGDTVLIDRARTAPPGCPPASSSRPRKTPHRPTAAPVFAFIDPDGHARIKHLRRHPELGLSATSANPSHAPELYPPDEAARITILGQVVAFGRGIRSLAPR